MRNIYDPEWHCKIDEGLSGLAFARFAPNSVNLITLSEFNVRLTIWSLTSQKQKPLYILNPKFSNKGFDFIGSTMCLVQQEIDQNGSSKDLIALYDTK